AIARRGSAAPIPHTKPQPADRPCSSFALRAKGATQVSSGSFLSARRVWCAMYDLLVIGAGSGGVRAARVAAGYGAKVAIAEEYRIGGTCVIRGCVPKKLLVYGAHFAEDLEDAARFGWRIEEAAFDWKTLRDNVLSEVARISGVYTQTLQNHGVEILNERAVVTGSNRVRVGEREISAKTILIATGAYPQIPERPGVEHGITSNE